MELKYFAHDTHMGAVHLNVFDLDNSVRFYNEILGMNILSVTSEYTVLGVAERPLLYLYAVTREDNIQQAGLFHFALLVPDRAALGNIFFHLIRSEYPLSGASDHDVSEAIYLQDPEGNGIEIYRDIPHTQWRYEDDGTIIMGTKEMDFQGVLDANKNHSFTGLSEDTIMGHIHLSVIDLDSTLQFYNDVFGMDVMTSYGSQAAFMSTGGYHHHLGLNVWQHKSIRPSITSPGLRKFEIKIPNSEDFDYFKKKMDELGLTTEKDGNSEIIRDPNGIGIRIMYKK